MTKISSSLNDPISSLDDNDPISSSLERHPNVNDSLCSGNYVRLAISLLPVGFVSIEFASGSLSANNEERALLNLIFYLLPFFIRKEMHSISSFRSFLCIVFPLICHLLAKLMPLTVPCSSKSVRISRSFRVCKR